MAKKPNAALVAPTPTPSASADDRKNDRVAKREWITEDGEATNDERLASGFRYTLLATGDTIEDHVGEPGDWRTMYAIFGALTKLGNEVNTVKAKGEAVTIDPAAAFHTHLRETGEWGVPSTGGGGPRINFDRLIAAINARADEKEAAGEVADRNKALDKLGSAPHYDVDYAKALLKNAGISEHYRRLSGGAVTSDEEVF